MSGLRTLPSGAYSPSPRHRTKDDWEDWEDEDIITPIEDGDGPLLSPSPTTGNFSPKSNPLASKRQSLRRLKSRQRQKAQNAKAGIKVVTDMNALRQQQQQAASQLSQKRETRTGRYVDAAALNALEGVPAESSTASFPWSKKNKQSQPQPQQPRNKRLDLLKAEVPSQADVSPISGPIMIGFAMPEGSDVIISPQTAVVGTPVEFPSSGYSKNSTQLPPSKLQQLPTSVWSPDTETGIVSPEAQRSTLGARRNPRDTRATSIYVSDDEYDAPTPAPPPTQKGPRNKRDTRTTDIVVSGDEDDDMDTPVTLFEEDGTTPTTRRKPLKLKGQRRSAMVSHSRSQGWWDQVTSPFGPKSPTKTQSPVAKTPESERGNSWWRSENGKEALNPRHQSNNSNTAAGSRSNTGRARPPSIIIEHVSSRSDSPPPSKKALSPSRDESRTEKTATATVTLAVQQHTPGLVECPPPYSPPPKKNINARENVRYRAVLPPGHPLAATLYPPSPGPVSPGIAGTMTSQGAIGLSNVPLTPVAAAMQNPRHIINFPDPPAGTFAPGHHLATATRRGPGQKAERQRRRHEKEDVVARKVGGLWRGRGCISEKGCFGRSGREGRKRRRGWCLGILGLVLLIILGVVLGVTLSKRRSEDSTPYTPFLNLTNFPPIPTGIATIVGPNTDTTSVCVTPSTQWSCALPKEQADSVAPFSSDRPTFVFQIQFDNNTRNPWNVTGQQPRQPPPTPTRPQARGEALSVIPLLRKLIRARQEDQSLAPSAGFNPIPAPPSFQDMFFLGNTTDNVVSDDKAGEPTPFYLSVLQSIHDSIGPNVLTRRADDAGSSLAKVNLSNVQLPPPTLNPDGTGAPALLFPFAKQQPLRLYDRGLPTERFGFYTYYNKTIYTTVVELPNNTASTTGPASDTNGGALETEAKFLVTFLSARFKVEIWTRRENNTRLLSGNVSNDNSTQPGTFPYPVTVTMDNHGGIPGQKFAFSRGVVGQRIVTNDARFVLNFMNQTGDLVNPASKFNPALGGMDGGSGGCKCQYTNFVRLNGVDAEGKTIQQ